MNFLHYQISKREPRLERVDKMKQETNCLYSRRCGLDKTQVGNQEFSEPPNMLVQFKS